MTDRSQQESQRSRKTLVPQEEIQKRINYDSPSKYDIDFYIRKTNRLENDLAQLQDELGLARFRLHKAEDFEIKYELLAKQNLSLTNENQKLSKELTYRLRQVDDLKNRVTKEEILKGEQENQSTQLRQELSDVKSRLDQFRERSRIELNTQKTNLDTQYARQLDNLKKEARDVQTSLRLEIQQLKQLIASKDNSEETSNFKLEKLRNDKNQEIKRLNSIIAALKEEATLQTEHTNEKILNIRNEFHNSTNDRVAELTDISETTKRLLMKEIQNMRQTLGSKNSEISLLLELEKRFIEEHERVTDQLKAHVKTLQDKIFLIHRENELEIFNAIARLKAQHDADIATAKQDFRKVQKFYEEKVADLNQFIAKMKEERAILESHIQKVEGDHFKLAKDKELAIAGLSQKILKLESMKDEELRNIGTSVKLIQEEAEAKIRDLHTAMLNKNSQFQILNAQLQLKNKQISHLLDQIHTLRNENRDRIQKLEDLYTAEQELVNQENAKLKKDILELRRRINELINEVEDQEKQFKLQQELDREALLQQREANERITNKNDMLMAYAKELEDDLKRERTNNVNVLQDSNGARRETVQERQKVKGEMENIKNKEIDQMRNIFNIDLNKLKTENSNLAHRLKEKADQYNKLLNDYKDLESQLSQQARGRHNRIEDQARRKATLDCEINLTRNIVSAISDKK